jgi:hypothetical protein
MTKCGLNVMDTFGHLCCSGAKPWDVKLPYRFISIATNFKKSIPHISTAKSQIKVDPSLFLNKNILGPLLLQKLCHAKPKLYSFGSFRVNKWYNFFNI